MREMSKRYSYFVGIDEVGRGPIAGPVTVCALVLQERAPQFCLGVKDSKKLSATKREKWFEVIKEKQKEGVLNFAVLSLSEKTIDKIGISACIKQCLTKALEKLELNPAECLVLLDGGLKAPVEYTQETIIKGDEKEAAIALASIVAKVTRDIYMEKLGEKYPAYGFEVHKGYGTKGHYEAIKKGGISSIHRKSFLKSLAP